MGSDEDFFSDDDLADIPQNTLEALEQQAFTSTQKQQQPPKTSRYRPPVPLRKQAHNASSLNRGNGLNKNLPWRPPQPSRPLQNPIAQVRAQDSAPPASAPEPPSSDYGFDDEDVIDLDEPSMVIQPASGPIAKRSNGSRYGSKAALDPETEAAFAAADAELGSQTFARYTSQQQKPHAGGSMDVSALQKRIAELESEQARLRRSEEEARNDARVKQGEIAIVRSNQDKLTKQYEARISVLQRLHADETTKAKQEIEDQRKEREKMQTDNRFLQHDLAQEANRAKRTAGPSRSRTAPSITQRDTPRKSRRTALGDGFDDNEAHVVSPSKSRERDRTRDGTPKVGAKRKRPVNDSPAAALSFTQPPQPVRHESSEQTAASFDQPLAEPVVVQKDDKYEYVQLILNHSPYEGHERTVEALTKYAFPSKPSKSLSSILIDKITRVSSDNENLCLQTAGALLDLWSQSLQESYVEPFYLILDMLRFALRSEPASIKVRILDRAVRLCTESIDTISTTLVKASTNRTWASQLDRAAFETVAEQLDVEEILDFLKTLCDSASLSADWNETFWASMNDHSLLVYLNKAQPMSQILTTLAMLQSSARTSTFGAISLELLKQGEQEKQLIDRLTNLLFEIPEPPADEPAYSEQELLELRLGVLKVFREVCQTDHGTSTIIQRTSAIGRLVRFLHAHVNKLYRLRPTVGAEESSAVHDLVTKVVSLTTRLLHHVLRALSDPPAIVQKLNAVHGGYHKFVVSLTRIAFTEQLAFEAGIEDEAAEAAHSILDNVLGPEDGDAIMQAFETPRGTRPLSTDQHSDGEDDTTMIEPG